MGSLCMRDSSAVRARERRERQRRDERYNVLELARRECLEDELVDVDDKLKRHGIQHQVGDRHRVDQVQRAAP